MDLTTTTIGQLLLFCTTVLGFVIQMYRENRNRRWDLEDRERARKELAAKVEIATVASVVKQAEVIQKIEENTQISREAFTEANNVNTKFLALAGAINASYDRRVVGIRERDEDFKQIIADAKVAIDDTKVAVEETKHTAEDTLAAVEKIDKKLP